MKTRVDLLITRGTVLAEAGREAAENWSIAVRNGLILDLGPSENLAQQYEAPSEIDALGCLVMPGLINTHTHIGMSYLRGLADDQPLMEWLTKTIFPAEAKLTANQVYWSSMLSCAEMIRSGTTTFCDMYLFEQEVAKATERAGLRALVGEGLFGFPSPNYGQIDSGIEYTRKLIYDWKGHSRIRIGVMPHAPYTCPPALLGLSAKLARELNVPISIHLSETKHELEEIQRDHGCSPVELLERVGLLGEDVIAAHCVHLSERDFELLKLRGVRVAHNPESNMKLASGVAPIPELLRRGIKVGLGTDGPASNNDLDMFGEMRSASLLQKVSSFDPTALSATDTLRLATSGGAAVLGLEESVGTLQPGRLADIIILDLQKPHLQPFYRPESQIVYATKGSDVRDTIVQGKVLMRNGKIMSFDEGEVFEQMKAIQQKVLKDLGK